MHVAKQFSKNLEKAQNQNGVMFNCDLGCSVMTPETLSSCSTSCHFEGRGFRLNSRFHAGSYMFIVLCTLTHQLLVL